MLAARGPTRERKREKQDVFELSMVWRSAQDNDPAERWLRSLIKMFIGDPEQLGLPHP